MTLAATAISADAVTTRNISGFRFPGFTPEANPIARPFISSNAGTVAYFSAAAGGVVWGNHLLRNHPRWRHAFNWTVIASETSLAVWNHEISVKESRIRSCSALWVQQGIIVPPCSLANVQSH